jgi:hypothetical protein
MIKNVIYSYNYLKPYLNLPFIFDKLGFGTENAKNN